MKLRDPEKWQSWLDANPPPSVGSDPVTWDGMDQEDMDRGYGYCVILAAEWWADEMERRIAEGAAVETMADAAFSVVDQRLGRWGLTGFQYGCAVSMLAAAWEHGEALRRWHNLTTQIGTEGKRANATRGVLNPALLNVELR